MNPAYSKYDELFLAIASSEGNIEGLLDAFFSFLSRKTDFFHVMTRPDEKIGFPPHKAFNMLQECFEKHQQNYLSRAQPHLLGSKIFESIRPNKNAQQSSGDKKGNSSKKQLDAGAQERVPEKKSQNDAKTTDKNASPESSPQPCGNQPIDKTERQEAEHRAAIGGSNEQQQPLQNRKQIHRISTHNGGRSPLYYWNQSMTDLQAEFLLPEPHPIDKQQLKVDLGSTGLRIEYKGVTVWDGEFYESPIPLDGGGTLWTIDDSKLLVMLEKPRETWWGNVFKGEEEIDTNKVDSTRKMNEFDPETKV